MNNGTGRIAADSLDRTVWSWYWALCRLLTRFSL